jgi:hypothetical protein
LRTSLLTTAATVGFVILLGREVPAEAAEIKVLSSSATGVIAVMNELGTQFDRATSHKLVRGDGRFYSTCRYARRRLR